MHCNTKQPNAPKCHRLPTTPNFNLNPHHVRSQHLYQSNSIRSIMLFLSRLSLPRLLLRHQPPWRTCLTSTAHDAANGPYRANYTTTVPAARMGISTSACAATVMSKDATIGSATALERKTVGTAMLLLKAGHKVKKNLTSSIRGGSSAKQGQLNCKKARSASPASHIRTTTTGGVRATALRALGVTATTA